jgi:hypothetical protein
MRHRAREALTHGTSSTPELRGGERLKGEVTLHLLLLSRLRGGTPSWRLEAYF